MLPRQTPHWLLRLVGTTALYALLAWAALRLAIPRGHAAPLFPAAGIALAAVLSWGWRMSAGVALASFAVNLMLVIEHGSAMTLDAVALAATVGLGAALQAAIGAALVRRYVSQPLSLAEPRDIALFFGLGGVLACLTSASVGTLGLVCFAHLPPKGLWLGWCTWAAGDTLGVLSAAPILLTLIGRPRGDWAPRRLTVGVSLAVAAGLLALGIQQVDRWEAARVQAAFEREAVDATASLAEQLAYPLYALEALRGVYMVTDEVTREELQRATARWLAPGGHVQALGWSQFVPRADAAAFEARVRASDFSDFHLVDRADSPSQAGPDDAMTIVRLVEPLEGNQHVLGLNSRSIAEARSAIDAAVRSGAPVASAGFRTLHDEADRTSVLIFHAVYHAAPNNPSDRVANLRGLVFVSLRMNDLLLALQSGLPSHLHTCIVDTDPSAQRKRLAGAAGCESQSSDLLHVRALAYAGRTWELRVLASHDDMPSSRARSALLFSLVGVLSTAMLGALLLTVTGRTRRIEAAVKDRTAALQREITERERTEADLRASQQRFRNILNNVPIGVVYTDLQGNVKQVNPRFSELTGYTGRELVAMNVAALTHPDERESDLALSRQLVDGAIPMYRRQSRYLRRDRRVVWVQTVVTLLRDVQGLPYRIVGVVEDITEHLRLAEAERAREIAEAANRAKSEFLSRMSHELRTPLNAMLGFSQLLELDQAPPLAPAHRSWVSQIQGAGWHLLEMINDVLDLSRIESGTLNLQPESLDLRKLVSAALSLVNQDAQRRNIAVSIDMPESAVRAVGDGTRVKQILINLLSNAVKYNRVGGRIHIASRPGRAGYVELIVTDTGLGMSEQQLAQLFQPFNRLGRERTPLGGTGIGLVVSQQLAELMGGALRVRSTAGEGSSFVLELPHAERGHTVPGALSELPADATQYHQRVVHYVEDNETNVEVMRGILLRRPQVRLTISITGLDGLSAIRATRPDLILLDMQLPDIDGLELLRHLKADPLTADIPVVVVSADALATQIAAASQAGALQYVTKPVSVPQLLTVIDAILESVDTRFGQIT